MTGWFARTGSPLTPHERVVVADLTRIAAPDAPFAVTAVASWQEAAAFARLSDHDSTWWNQEEEEREWLWARASELRSEADLLQSVDAVARSVQDAIREAANAAVALAGVTDAGIIAGEACAMALLAAHHNALAELAGEGPGHRFRLKYVLFAGGRWPLGYHSARFVIF